MDYLDVTLPTLVENLALDEALLNDADARPDPLPGILRIWESPELAVVVGRSTKVNGEVHHEACSQDGVPIYRRCSGGTSVVVGPGCLMYSVLISYAVHPELRSVDAAHAFVMGTMQTGLNRIPTLTKAGIQVDFRGSCDLTLNDTKFSGNALRCKRNTLLYHGTFLYDFPLERISRYLASPPRQPEYRNGRTHDAFVTNLPCSAEEIARAVRDSWKATNEVGHWPEEATRELVAERYTREAWNLGR